MEKDKCERVCDRRERLRRLLSGDLEDLGDALGEAEMQKYRRQFGKERKRERA